MPQEFLQYRQNMTQKVLKNCEVYAHRGGAGLFPESTLPAYEHALTLGADVLDIDIAITKDNVIVASHDVFLNPSFTRDSKGQWLNRNDILVKNLTFTELQEFDVGRLNVESSYAKLYPEQQPVDGSKIPSLQQIIDLARAIKGNDFRLQIEIKTNPLLPDVTLTPEKLMPILYELLKDNVCIQHVEIHSFDWRNMLLLQKIDTQCQTSYITSKQDALMALDALPWHGGYDVNDYHDSYPQLIASIGGKVWCPDYKDLTYQQVMEAHNLGLKVTTWTANTLESMYDLINLGVDGIITDRPDLLLHLLDR